MSKHPIHDRNPARAAGFIAVLITIGLVVSGCDQGDSNQGPAPVSESVATPAPDMNTQTPAAVAETPSVSAVTESVSASPVQAADAAAVSAGAPVQAVATAAVSAEATVQEAATGAVSAAAGSVDGEKVYKGLCVNCHGTGLPNIPQIGNKEAWAPRIAQGKDVLYQHALKGFTGTSGMPMLPKGGNIALTDDEVKAAVDHMVSNSQ